VNHSSLVHTVTLVAWQRVGLDQRSYSTPGPVSTWMGDRLRAGKPSRYVNSQLGQLSLPSVRGRLVEYQPLGLGGARSPVSGGRQHVIL